MDGNETKTDKSEIKSEIKSDIESENDFEIGAENEIADTLITEMSEVSEHAVNAGKDEVETKSEEFPGFDPNLHAVDNDGKPIPKKSGGWCKIRGVKKGATTGPKSTVGGINDSKIVQNGSTAAGVAAANLLITLGLTIGGNEFQPIYNKEYGIDEKANLETSFAAYFESTGRTDFPPGIALSIAVGGYILPRFSQPATKSRLTRLGEWIYLKFRRIKKKKQPQPPHVPDEAKK